MANEGVRVDENGFPLSIPEAYRKFRFNPLAIERAFFIIEEEKDKLGESAYFDDLRMEEKEKRDEEIRALKDEQRRYSRRDNQYHRLQDQIDRIENPFCDFGC